MKMKRFCGVIICAVMASVIAVAQLPVRFSRTAVEELNTNGERVTMKQENNNAHVMLNSVSVRDNRHVQRNWASEEGIDLYGFVENNVSVSEGASTHICQRCNFDYLTFHQLLCFFCPEHIVHCVVEWTQIGEELFL